MSNGGQNHDYASQLGEVMRGKMGHLEWLTGLESDMQTRNAAQRRIANTVCMMGLEMGEMREAQ